MDALRALTVITIVITCLIDAKAFREQPLSVERAEGLEAVFRCLYPAEGLDVTYDWFINNSIVSTDTGTVRVRRPSSPGGPATLTILTTPQHNNSVIHCEATIRNGFDFVRSKVSITATLTVRATIIDYVLTTPNNIIVILRALPHTGYCVNITKTTLDSTEEIVLDSVCFNGRADEYIFEYIFTYSNPISVCDRFSFTVTPTEGEMRGTTSEPDTGFFTRAEGSIEEPHRVHESGENKSVEFEAFIPSCTRFTRYRVDSDLLSTPINLPITDPLLFDGSLSFSLPTDKMTEYSVTLTDENGIDLVFENIPISTFDVQDLLVSECPGPGGGICVSIVYVEGTVSPGALVYAVRIIDGELDFASMKLVPIRRNLMDNFTIPVAVSGNYSVIAFDLENNNMSVPRIPISLVANNETFFLSSKSSTVPNSPPNSDGITVAKLSNGSAEVTCTTTGQSCLALFQSKTSLDPMVMIGLIEPPNDRTTVTLNATSDVYVVVYTWNSDSGETIFDGKVSFISQLELLITTTQPSTTDTTISEQTTSSSGATSAQRCTGGCIAGIIIGFLIVLVVVVIVVIVVCYCRSKKTKKSVALKVSSSHEMGQQSEKLTPSHGDQVDPVSDSPPTETFKNADAADPAADKSPDVIPGNEDVDAGPDSNALIYADLEMATKGKNKAKVDATVTPTGGAEGHEAVEYASIEHFKKSDKSEGDEDN